MEIVITDYGTYLRKRDETFLIVREGKKSSEISAKKVERILITVHSLISSDAIELAVENNIDIVFLKDTGQPIGRVWHSKLGSITTIRRKQLFLQDNSYGLKLVKQWLSIKVQNQIDHLNKLIMNRRNSTGEAIKKIAIEMQDNKKSILAISNDKTLNEVRNTLQGYEGNASYQYFKALSIAIPEKYKFNGRSRNPAKDEFNCMLNYGYGILYSRVEKACIIAGLDPYIGIMHTDNYNKKALVFDIIEMYRYIIEEVVFKLFSTKQVTEECFDIVNDDDYYLNKEGKQLLIKEYNKKLQEKIKRNNRNIELSNIIQYDCHRIANELLEQEL